MQLSVDRVDTRDFSTTAQPFIVILLLLLSLTDHQWLMRVVRLLSALGEFAFRELSVYFHQIDSLRIPECLQCHLNVRHYFLYM